MTKSHWFAKNVESDFFFSRIIATKNEAESNSENKHEYKVCQIVLRLNQWRQFDNDKYCKIFLCMKKLAQRISTNLRSLYLYSITPKLLSS